MKFRLAALVVLALAVSASLVSAKPMQSLGLGGGADLVMGPWRNVAGNGVNAGGSYGIDFGPHFGLGLDVTLHTLGEHNWGKGLKTTSLRTVSLEPSLRARYYFAPKGDKKRRFVPYLTAGAGVYRVSQQFHGPVPTSANTDLMLVEPREFRLGYGGGGGLRIANGETSSIDLEARYQQIPFPANSELTTGGNWYGQDASLNTVTFAVRFNFMLKK